MNPAAGCEFRSDRLNRLASVIVDGKPVFCSCPRLTAAMLREVLRREGFKVEEPKCT